MKASFYKNNREKFKKLLKPFSIAIISAYDAFPRTGDQFFPYKTNPNLLYLTGVEQAESILFLFPDCPNPAYREILFINVRNEAAEIWYGKRLSKEEATRISGIENINWISSFQSVLRDAMTYAENIYLDYNETGGYQGNDSYKQLRLINEIKAAFPLHNYLRTYPLVSSLRQIKANEEIEILKDAIDITAMAFDNILKETKPHKMEYEIEAVITSTFLKNNARFHGFKPIVAAGINACYLHYNENKSECQDGDLLLIDMGAEYKNYTSDISRTIPVNGIFSNRQKKVYAAVLNLQKMAFKMYVVGNTIHHINTQMATLVEEELVKLNLITTDELKKQNPETPLYKKYFPHGTSHFLGMDAHDTGNRFVTFKPGMVLTCEPAIYIFEEQIGIRLENDVLITRKGPVNLSEKIPIEIEHIESIMKKK